MSDASASASDREGHEPSSRITGHVFATAGAVLAFAMLGIGGLPPTITCLFGLGASALLAFTAWQQTRSQSPSWPLLPLVFGALALWTLAQSVPLPMPLLRAIAPQNADVWARALIPAGLPPPSSAPISLAPELTLLEAIKWASYAALAWAGHAWGRARGLEQVALLVLGLGVLAAVVTALHGALHLSSVFGVYTPTIVYPRWRMGPLLNANHLSGYLTLGAYGGLSLLIASREPPTGRTALVLAGTASLVLGVVLLASRAAVALLVIGALLLPATLFQPGAKKRRGPDAPRRTGIALAAAVFVGGVTLALYGFSEDVLSGLADRDWSKVKLLHDAAPLLRDHFRVGIGRGAFEGAFFAYKTISSYEVWTHPENIAVQWASEWGAPAALAGALGVAAAIGLASSWRSSVTARVLFLGVLLVVAQNLLDFSLEVPAVAGLVAFLLGALTGSPGGSSERSSRSSREGRSRSPSRARATVGIAWASLLCLLSIAGLARRPESLASVRASAYRLAEAKDSTSVEPIVGWMKRFPAEPYLPLAAGIIASREVPAKGMPWFNRALERAPNLGAVHMALATTLARAGFRSQALLEVRYAVERDPVGTSGAATLTAMLARTAAEAIATAPLESSDGLEFLKEVAAQMRDPSSAAGVRAFVLDRAPCTLRLREQNARDLLNQMAQGREPCSGPTGIASCKAMVEPEIAKVAGCPDGTALAEMLQADLLWVTGEQEASLKMLDQTCATQAGDITVCLSTLADRAASLKDAERVRRAVRVVVSRRCQGTEACSQAWSWAATAHDRSGDYASAYVAATKATEIDPTNIALKLQLAEAALKVGARDKAEQLLAGVVARHPEVSQARERLAQVRAMPPPERPSPADASPASSSSPRRPPSSLLDRLPPPGKGAPRR